MSNPWLRRNAGDRVWPFPDRALYLKHFCALPALTPFQRITGWTSSPGTRLLRVLEMHRRAFGAECRGRFRTADFFWHEAVTGLRRLWRARAPWDAAARTWPETPQPTGEDLRRRVATELFIDSHIAFANGCLASQDDAGRARAEVHTRHLETLLALQSPPLADVHQALLPAIEAAVDADEAASRFDEAIARIRGIRLPSVRVALADRLVTLLFRRCLARLAPRPEGNELADARWLADTISELKALAADRGDLISAHEPIAQLLHLRSIRLADGGKVSEALVASEEAACHSPGFEAAAQTMARLVERMTSLQEQCKAIRAHLKCVSNHQLNDDGRRMLADGKRGFAPLNRFRASDAPADIAQARALAQARRLWRDIDPASRRPPDEHLLALCPLVASLLASGPAGEEELVAAFTDACAGQSALLYFDACQIGAFIVRRRAENNAGTQSGAAAPPDTATPTLLIPHVAPAPRDREPWAHRCFGTQHRGTRAFGALAAACAVAVAGLSVVERQNRQTRDSALEQLRTPGLAPEAAMAAAERFLQARTPAWTDLRQDEVLDAYAKAFAQWSAAIEDPTTADARARLARYRAASARGGTR